MTTTGDLRDGELDAGRRAAVAMLRSALAGLAVAGAADATAAAVTSTADRSAVADATTRAVVPAPARVRRRGTKQPDCRSTRAALHDYLSGRLLPHRRRRLEAHLDGCAECIRAFIDVREESWMLRDLGQHLVATGHRGGRHRRMLRRPVVPATGSRPASAPSTSRGR